MKRRWSTALAGALFAGSLVWFFLENDHKYYWLLLMTLSIAVTAVGGLVRKSKPPR